MITEHYKEKEEPLYKNNDITIIYMWHPPYFKSIIPHWHTRTEFLLVLEGELDVTCGNYSGTLIKDDLLIVNPHQLHAATSGTEGVKYYAVILENRLGDGMRLKIDDNFVKLFPSAYRFQNHIKDNRISHLLLNIIEEEEKKNAFHEIFSQAFIVEIFAILHRQYIDARIPNPGIDSEFLKILTYIDENYADTLSTEFISNLLGYNKSHFCRKFKQYTGTNFTKYLNILRLEKAISLIKSTDNTISEIALKVGFNSPNYFTRLFTEHFGQSPTSLLLTYE